MAENSTEYFRINKKVFFAIFWVLVVLVGIWTAKSVFLTMMATQSRASGSAYPKKIGDSYVDVSEHINNSFCPVPAGSKVYAWAGGNVNSACRAVVVKSSYKSGSLYFHDCVYSKKYTDQSTGIPKDVNIQNCFDAKVVPTYAVQGGVGPGVSSASDIAANMNSLCPGKRDKYGNLIYGFSGIKNPKCVLFGGKAKQNSDGLVNCIDRVIRDPEEIVNTC